MRGLSPSKTAETALEVFEGMEFGRGFISPYFTHRLRGKCAPSH